MTTSPRPSILYVDDDEDTRELAQLSLQVHGFTIVTARDAHEALEQLGAGAFPVAVVDLGLPGVDGLELARRACAQLGERAPYLIALTGFGSEKHRELSREAGFAEHLLKPTPPEVLAEAIARGLSAR